MAQLEALLAPPAAAPPSLSERFGVPPFSVLDARAGYWQERKAEWMALGIQSELGRGGNLLRYSKTVREPDPKKRGEMEEEELAGGTSVFDPVLCELVVRWFSPPGGSILDPFAGGSVRGIVASHLGRQYWGIDLRPEQVEANRKQAAEIGGSPRPEWVEGDARNLTSLPPFPEIFEADLIFTCPPYFDLEQYSEDSRDLSNAKSWPRFIGDLQEILELAYERLRNHRFAVIVVGEIRDKAGIYRGLVPAAIHAAEEAGFDFYNEAILVTSVGTLPIRVNAMFSKARKLGKTHQNVLIFCKGDPRKAAEACGEIEIALDLEEALDGSS